MYVCHHPIPIPPITLSLYSNHSAESYLTQPSSSSPGSPPAMSAAFKAFLNSPVGPKTTHFWGPVSNWGIILAVRAPVDSIGVSSSHSLPGVLFVLTTLASPLAATRENSSSRSWTVSLQAWASRSVSVALAELLVCFESNSSSSEMDAEHACPLPSIYGSNRVLLVGMNERSLQSTDAPYNSSTKLRQGAAHCWHLTAPTESLLLFSSFSFNSSSPVMCLLQQASFGLPLLRTVWFTYW